MAESTSAGDATVGRTLQQAVVAMLRWASRSGVRAELWGRGGVPLSFTDVLILGAIVDDGPVRVTELAAWQGVDKSTMTPQVRRLERQGLIERRPDPRDNRAALLFATTSGKRQHGRVIDSGARVFDELLDTWTAADRHQLGELLARFSQELRGHSTRPSDG